MTIERLIAEHGTWSYLITFAWTFFEGESFVLVAGFAAAQGLLSLPLLFIASWLGSFSGDQCYFWIGRRFGLRVLGRRPTWRARVDKALGWLKRYDAGFILSFRFIYGVRNFSSFALGISGIGWRRFFALNLIAAALWAAVFVSAGYLCGHAFERALGDIAERFSLFMLGGFALLLIGVHVIHRLRRRHATQAASPPS
jgi:membrane protein DedA with SNARE-associated domain